MATSLIPLRPVMIRACTGSGPQKPDPNVRKSCSTSNSSTANWWAPLFGWSSDPDYIGSENKLSSRSVPDPQPKPSRTRFSPGSFTEEKARQLRMLTNDASSFHDAMYHSAIASRLASDFKYRSDR